MTNTRTANLPNLTPTLARNGVWTPWAQVLCVECDYREMTYGANVLRTTTYANHYESLMRMGNQRTAEIEQPEGEALAKCDKCNCDCWVRFDVAMCQRVGLVYGELSWSMDDVSAGFEMEQTGGMCCAATFHVRLHDDAFTDAVVVVSAMDGAFYVGSYKRTDEPLDEPINWDNAVAHWEGPSFYADEDGHGSGYRVGEAVLDVMVAEAAGKVIDFVRNLCKELKL